MSNQREHREAVSPAIAVVGVSALFPGSTDVRGFWRTIVEGQNQIKEVPPNYWLIEDYYDPNPAAPDKTYGKTGAFLDAVPFDALGYGVPPNVVQQTDTSQLLGLIVAQRVLEDAAGGDFQHIDKSRISVILGATGATELVVHLGSRLQRPIWLNALRANGVPEDEAQAICDRIADSYVPWTEASFPGLLGNVVAGRIANKFDLGGTNCVVDAACASSLSALAMGLSELYLGQSDMVIVGGVDTLNDILMYMCFSKTPALSATGDCRPFSDQADGTILGEGLGMLALRRLEDAERDGDRIYAVIRGIGSSSDGKGTAVYAPKASGQAHALRRAYAAAGYSPRTVELLEAHGTATKAGDVAEFGGASSVFAEADPESRQWCAIGSVKSQIGHTKGAAGAASLIKAVLALHHKVLPPTIKVERPNPNLAVEESPFYVNTQTRPWVRDASHPRRAGVSSFGFGGSNFHVTLEEYTGDSRKAEFRPAPTELFLVSANDVAELLGAAQTLTTGIDDERGFQFLARASQIAWRSTDRLRLALIAGDLADLRAKVAAAANAIERNPANAQQSPAGWYYSGATASAHQDKLAFLFPGQGSQYVGMGGDLAKAFASSRAMWDEAANLEFEQGGRLQDVVFPQPVFSDADRTTQETRLRATDWAQPAIGVASLSLLTLLTRLGIKPDAVGGHSFGEVTALHTAGVLDRKAFMMVARKRGELMAEATAMFPGAMTAISHPADSVAALLATWNTGVVIANHNSPEQVVISGIESAIQATEEHLRQASIRFQRLPVSTAFHSTVVRPAAAPFRTFLEHVAIHKPQMAVYANSTAAIYSNVPDAIRDTLASQIAEPVRFAEQIAAMYAAGVRTFVEVGPGTVLTNLVRSCLQERPHRAIPLDRKGQHGLTSLWHGLAQLATAGVAVAFDRLWDGVDAGEDPRLRKTPKLAVNISGVNYAKPYPPADGAAGLAAPNPARRGNNAMTHGQPAVAETGVAGNGRAASNGPVTRVAPPAERTVQPTAPVLPPVTQSAITHPPAASVGVRPAPAPPPMLTSIQATPPPVTVQPAPAPAAAPTAAPPPVVAAPAGESLAWVQAFQHLQQQTADAHMAFLQVAEQSMRSLEAMLSGARGEGRGAGVAASLDAPPANGAPMPTLAPPAPVMAPASIAPAVVAPVVVAPVVVAPPAIAPAIAPVAPVATSSVKVTSAEAGTRAVHVAPRPSPLAPDLHSIMMAVVTEKTGYPTEMLERGMALDTDLGIDSIKRVEILAAVRERVPSLPEFDTNIMGSLRTLGEIVDYMDGQLGQTPAAQAEIGRLGDLEIGAHVAPRPSFLAPDLHSIMMAVVTEKTGYPTEMLERGMALDTDLGIDSIKRVEILAAVRERVPSLPEFDTNIMAGLRTLGEIVDYMDNQLGQTPAAQAEIGRLGDWEIGAHVAPRPSPLAPDLHSIMMAVVTEKTGYPTEMLERGMALDTDLGIDSIKRVEILAAVRERVPALPEFDTNIMAGLRTLGEIVDYMDGQLGQTSAAQAEIGRLGDWEIGAHVAPRPSPLAPDLHAIMMAVVTEKTGYPTEMLERGMALDTDLGIDSIKRVEILAAVRERVPSLPEFDTNIMAGLRTLGEIVDYMDGQLGGATAVSQNGIGRLGDYEIGAVAPRPSLLAPDPIRRFVLEMIPQPAPGLAPPFLADGTTVYITDDGRGIAPLLAAQLQQAGAQTQVVAAVPAVPADARAVICLDGLRPVRDAEAALAVNADVFQIATTVAAGYEANGGLFVTVQDTGGDHGLFSASGDRAWLGGLSGLAKTAAQEWPKAVVRTLDLAASGATPEAVAERLAAELLHGGADREIGLTADGGRYAFVSTEKAASGGAPVVTPDAVIVVSGGGRGVTAATLIALAQSAHPRIALLGRSVLAEEPAELRTIADDAGLKKALLAAAQANGKRLTPRELGVAADRILAGREIRATLASLHAAGSEAIYLSCDVTDPAATAATLGEIRARLGPITGLVHGAGVLADKRLAEKTADDFQRVFGAKIGGLSALLAATADDPLKVICLFSSVAARTGNAGQADYAMANEVLNRVAHELAYTRPGCVVKSIGWGPWAGGMVTPVLKAKFDEMGVPLIPLENGARRFVAELQQADRSEVETVIGGAPQEGPLINPQQAAGVRAADYDVVVSAATDPYLRSHEVNGVVVVPLVLVQEWFLRAAKAAGATPTYNALHKLRVLKGIPLPAFGERPTRLRIHIEPDAGDPAALNATLYDEAGVARFAAQVVQQPPESAEALTKIAAASAAWPHAAVAGASLYGAQLFHGPAFATLQQVDRLGEQGARADLIGSQSVGWDAPRPSPLAPPWRTDPALIDGGLQLARVWGYERLQQLTLPTAVETFVVYEAGLLAAGRAVRCIVEGKPIGQAGTRTNLWYVDAASGALIATVRGLEMYKSSEAALVPAQVGGAQ